MAIDPHEAASRYLASVERYENALIRDIAVAEDLRPIAVFIPLAPVERLRLFVSGMVLSSSLSQSTDPEIVNVRLEWLNPQERAEAVLGMPPEDPLVIPTEW